MSIESNQCSSHFVNGISNNNSIFHQSIQYPDEPSEGIRACIIGRERIYKLLVSPDFAKTIVDCFVRIVDQNSSDDSKKYKIARVVSVLDGVDHDCYGQNNGTLLQLDDKTEINLDVISEEPAEEIEIQQWLMSMIRKNKPTPSNGQLRNKITEIASALSWPFSPSDKHIETDYYSLYEKTNLAGNIDDSEITDVEHVLTDVIECLENEEVNECQMDQEIAETMVIDQMTGEQVFPEHEDSEMGMNIDNIPSEFSQVSDNNEGLRQSNNRSNQVCTNSDGLIVGYLTEDNRFKIYIADDEGINGSAISPNKHGTKEKNCIEYIEYLEDILPIILSKTFLIQIMHSSEFNQLVTDCFVFIKHKTNSNENNEMSMESTNKEEYKLARICKVEDTENVYCYEELFYQKRILLDSNDDIFELSLNNVLDRQPTNEEFKNWVLAISNKTKKLIKTIIPTLQFVITKHVKIDTCRTNSLREKNLQLYKLANSETAIIYEKQKKLTTYDELLQIFLKRSQIVKIIRQQNFSKTVIGSFVRFLYNLPNIPRSEHSQAQDSLRYKIVQIVGVHKCDVPYSVGRFSVDKELKIEWDRVIVHCKISSISDTIPSQKEFDNWMTSIENKHSGSTIPSIYFLKSKALAIRNALDLEENDQQINVPSTSEKNKNGNSFEMSTSIVAESQSQTKNIVHTPEPITTRSNISSSTPSLPPRTSISTPAIATDIPSTSSVQRPKGFGIIKHINNCLSEGPQLRKREQPIIAKPLLRKTAKKVQTKMQPPTRNFYNQLTQRDKEVLLKNGFKGRVNVRINKKEFDKLLILANCLEVTKKNMNVDNELLTDTLTRLQTQSSRKRPRSPPISSTDNFGNSKNNTGGCANICVGEPISIQNVGVSMQDENPSEYHQPQQKLKKQDSLSTLPAQLNQVKMEINEIEELKK